jgi:hypothetical protein
MSIFGWRILPEFVDLVSVFGGRVMRNRRRTAVLLERTAPLRRIAGAILIAAGLSAWALAVILPPGRRPLAVIAGGALATGGIILIATSV